MDADEAGTLRRLTELRQDFLKPLIDEHHGRIVKLMGDGLLVEFASVVDAVTCALAWQDGVVQREAAAEENNRLQFRIGINLGDVIVEGDDIHGDGVNIAARLEGLAEPGGICLSDDTYRQVRGKIEASFEDLGGRHLRNVAEPVRVYRVASDSSGAANAASARKTCRCPTNPQSPYCPSPTCQVTPSKNFLPTASPAPTLA
jgi:adenylate cyclase